LFDQALAEHQFSGGGSEPTRRALVRRARGAAIEATGHAGEYTVRLRLVTAKGG